MPSPKKFLSLLAALALLAAACGSSTDTASEETTEAPTEESVDETDEATPEETTEATDTGNEFNGGKPVVDIPAGDAPTDLVTEDLIVGEGNAAAAGDLLEMHYVGVLFDDGSQFDASWDRGDTFSFVLGQGRVIQGWDEGIVGMTEGSRRVLTIPPAQAYGDNSPSPDIPNGSTLVFVVDLVAAHSPHEVDTTTGDATELEVTVISEGDGPEVTANSAIEVLYSIAPVSTGQVEQSSWTDGQTGNFVVGANPVEIFAGWSESLVGQNVGDELRIVVPPALGPDPERDDTLITHITILDILELG